MIFQKEKFCGKAKRLAGIISQSLMEFEAPTYCKGGPFGIPATILGGLYSLVGVCGISKSNTTAKNRSIRIENSHIGVDYGSFISCFFNVNQPRK